MAKMTIKQWRRVKDYTQEYMAEMCGVHRNTYAAWEENPEKIPIGAALTLADVLQVSIEDIIFWPIKQQNVVSTLKGDKFLKSVTLENKDRVYTISQLVKMGYPRSVLYRVAHAADSPALQFAGKGMYLFDIDELRAYLKGKEAAE